MGVKYNYVTEDAMLRAIEEGKKIEWEELPDNLKNSGKIALAAYNREGVSVLENFYKGTIDDKKYILEHPRAELYDYLTEDLQKDMEVILAVKKNVDSHYHDIVSLANWNYASPGRDVEEAAEEEYNRFNDILKRQTEANHDKEMEEMFNTETVVEQEDQLTR